jgi:hypothetical protein
MKRREPPASQGGYLFNGDVYATEAEYLAAKADRDERRRRLLSLVDDQDGNHA